MRIGINGYGRIGRVLHRILSRNTGSELVAINDINPDKNNIAYLANYDSTYGPLEDKFNIKDNRLVNSKESIEIFHENSIDNIPWRDLGVELVIDSSGISDNLLRARSLEGVVENVIVTNSPSEDLIDKTVIFGVNHEDICRDDFLISSSICDATAFAPLAKLINQSLGIKQGFLTTLHPWLGYQNLLDGPSKSYSAPGEIYDEYTLGRSSLNNLIPKNTSAISATYKVIPELRDKFLAVSYRVPTSIVSSADSTLILERETSLDEIKSLLTEAEKENPSIFLNNHEALVSTDLTKCDKSVVIDHRFLSVKGNYLKLLTWYDNEWGYSSRVIDLVGYLSDRRKK
jgi:glyceraldehyde 3-phosphate dehydrogenase